MSDFFPKEAATSYDEKNKQLAPISECLHFLIRLILKDLPNRSHILCNGVGTGAEILSLAGAHPEWTFVGVDPSTAMLEVCRKRLESAGVLKRCELVHGYVADLPLGESFDAVLSVLVAHFVKRSGQLCFFQEMTKRLKKNGYLVDAHISFDIDSKELPSMLRKWETVQELMGATPESLAQLPFLLREVLTVLPASEVENNLRQSGIGTPIRFFQALMISGWYGLKD